MLEAARCSNSAKRQPAAPAGRHRRNRLGRALLVLPAALTLLEPAQAQEAAADEKRFDVAVEARLLEVSVWDRQGRPARNLTLQDFSVTQDGREIPLLSLVPQPSSPISLAVLVDAGSSMKKADLRCAKQLVFDLIHLLDAEDEILLATYRDEPFFLTDLTSDRGVLVEALNNLAVGARPSRLGFLAGRGPQAHDAGVTFAFTNTDSHTGGAIDLSLQRLRHARRQSKAVLVISTSFAGLGPATLEHLKESGTRFFAVRLKDALGGLVSLGADQSSRRKIAAATGGTTLRGEGLLEELETLRDSLKSSYWIAFTPLPSEAAAGNGSGDQPDFRVAIRGRSSFRVSILRQ